MPKSRTKTPPRSTPSHSIEDMTTIGYARVSTIEQNLDAQQAALTAAGCTHIYTEHASGGTTQRPQWHACLDALTSGDTLIVTRIDRLGRSLSDLITIIDTLGRRGIEFRSLNEGIDTTTALGRLTFQLTAAFAEYERSLIIERTREGLAAARRRGSTPGRPRALTPEQASEARRLRTQGRSYRYIARVLGTSPSTIRRTTM